jgi:cytochrome c oxidase subunit 1
MSNDTHKGVGARPAWFQATEHHAIAKAFLGWTGGAFILAMILGAMPLLRVAGMSGFDMASYFQAVTYQRLVHLMAWLIPAIPAVLGFVLLPLQLGGRDLAFPELSRWSLRFYAAGLIFTVASLAWCPAGTGWTMDTQLALLDPGSFGLLTVGLFFLAVSWVSIGLNFIVTVHHGRREGTGFFDMPLTAWGLYLYSFLMVAAGLTFAIVVIYLAGSRVSVRGLFGWDADPMLWRTYFWFTMRPLVIFSLIPAVGVISDVISGITRQRSTGYRTLVGSMIALTGIAVLSYGVNLAGQGLSPSGVVVFSFMSLLAAVPVALISITWLSTMFRGSTTCGAPATFTVAFIMFAGASTLLGLFLASPAVGSFLGATMFASVQLEYLAWGAVLSALLAGLHYWWPRMFGGAYNDMASRASALLLIIGLNLALVPRLMLGTRGVPQDMAGAVEGNAGLMTVSSVGWIVVYVSIILVIGSLVPALWNPRRIDSNPWGAVTQEWNTAGAKDGE